MSEPLIEHLTEEIAYLRSVVAQLVSESINADHDLHPLPDRPRRPRRLDGTAPVRATKPGPAYDHTKD